MGEKDVSGYINFYSPMFSPEEGSYDAWQSQRRIRVGQAEKLQIDVSDIQVIPSFDDASVYETVFTQNYKAAHYQETSKKVLTWKATNSGWQIIRERNLPANTVYNGSTMSLAKSE
ncbi:MAG: hypothetical protein HC848_03225 [Limnobacter sp.]|nr:hypothetical protein [Limnobacter sp.]